MAKTEFNKRYSYMNYNFNIKVQLNYIVERRPGGKVTHRITVNDMGSSNYEQIYDMDATGSLQLKLETIEGEIRLSCKARENLGKSPAQLLLESLGYS
jgi:hypothetical protein